MNSRIACTAAGIALFAILALAMVSADYGSAESADDLASRLATASPGDTVIMSGDCTITGDLVVPAKVTLLLPFSETDKKGIANGTSEDSGRLNTDAPYITLTISEGATVKVFGTLVVGGVVAKNCYSYQYQCQTSGAHAQIINNGEICILNGGTLECHGYIDGKGVVDAASGASVIEPADIEDFTDGDTLLNLLKTGQSPFNRYSLDNIRCEMDIHSGATLIGDAYLYANKTLNHTSMKFIGSDNSLFTLRDGAVAVFTYDSDKYIVDENYDNALGNDIGKITITLTGGAEFRAAAISLQIIGQTITESLAQTQFSFPYTIDIVLRDGVYDFTEDFRILPGSVLTVEEDAFLTVHKKLYVFDGLVDIPWGYVNKKYYPGPELLKEYGYDTGGKLIVNGTMVVKGSFRGVVQSEGSGYVSIDSEADVGETVVEYGCDYSYKILFYSMDKTRNLTTRVMSGSLYGEDGALVPMVPGTNYTASSGTSYATSFTQTNAITGTTSTYYSTRTIQGVWHTTEEPVPVPVEKTYVDFTVTPSGDILEYGDIFLMMLSIKNRSFGLNEYPNLIADMRSYDSVTLSAQAMKEIGNVNADLTVILSDGTFRMSCGLVSALSDKDTQISFKTGTDDFNNAEKSTVGNRTSFSLSMIRDSEEIHELGYHVKVSFTYTCPEGSDASKLRIWYVEEDGTAHNYSASLNDGTLSFETPHFSAYAVSFDDPPTKGIEDFDFTNIIIIAVAAIIGIIALIVTAILLLRRRRRRRAAQI